MNILIKTILIISIISSSISADLIMGAYYNPGLKFGVQFGRKTEFVIGFENSITGCIGYGVPFAGIVGGIEYNFGQRKFIKYWEIEGGFAILGFAIGGEWNRGYQTSIRIFGGAIGFLSFKHLVNTRIYEISLIGKYPYSLYMVMDHGVYVFGREKDSK